MAGLRAVESEFYSKGVEAERGRVMALINRELEGWWRLYNDIGPNADVAVDTVIAELEQLRETILHGIKAEEE